MGKTEEEQREAVGFEVPNQNVENQWVWCGNSGYGCCGCCGKLIGVRCVLVLLLSAAVFLSALFWLPPFLKFADQQDLDLDAYKGHDIVASFKLKMPISLLQDNILQLQEDIFNEMAYTGIKVVILSLDSSGESNATKVVFGVDPDAKDSKISQADESMIRENFEYLVDQQLPLSLNTSLFGEPFLFEVLKFPGGITIVPTQKAFLLQKVQITFNFTLNFSIYQIQLNFNELKSQLKLGLHLAPYENLYVTLSNLKGSTIEAPTIVQSSVLLAVGTPSIQRSKQLAQTIKGSHSGNLGLNNTVFGRVKQVRLSDIHGDDGSGTSPSPAPMPHPHHHHHHHHHPHHHHHHHHHHHDTHLAPAIPPRSATEKGTPATHKGAPAPAHASPAPKSSPAPGRSYEAKPPGCRFGYNRGFPRNAKRHSHLVPTLAPYISHYPSSSPQAQAVTPAPIPHSISASSPLPNVVFAHVQPPSKSEHSDIMPSVAPSPSSSSVGRLHTAQWAFSLFLALVLQL